MEAVGAFPPERVVREEHYGTVFDLINPGTTTCVLRIYLRAGQTIRAVPGCMMATSANVEIQGRLKRTLKAIFGPDDATYQTLTAQGTTGWALLTPDFPGEIRAVPLAGTEEVLIGDDAYLACTDGIETTGRRQGLKQALFSTDGLFVKKAKGKGILFVAAVGSLMEWNLQSGESIVIDNKHLVLWSKSVNYEITKAAKGFISTGLSGEGMVAKMTGPGRVMAQSRSPTGMAKWIYSSYPPGAN